MGDWETWMKAGTGDDKTDIVVIADFWKRTGGLFSGTGTCPLTPFESPGADLTSAAPVSLAAFYSRRLLPTMFFGPGGIPLPGVNTPLPHSAPNAATSPFYKSPFCRSMF